MLIPYFFRFLQSNIKRLYNQHSPPFLLNYAITFKCNLDCKYCGVARLSNNYATAELTAKDISFFLKDRMLKDLKVVVISGGEPFLKEDFNEILMEFQRRVSPQVFHITTNGFLTDSIVECVKYLKGNGLNLELKVSIDDISAKHDLLRNKVGSFDKAVTTVQKLRSLFKAKELMIGINQTIFEENYQSIPEIKRLAGSLDAVYRGFVGLNKRSLYTGVREENYGLVDLSTKAKEFINCEFKDFYTWRSYFASNSRFSEEVIMNHYIKGQVRMIENKPLKPHRCMCLFTHFRLNPNGDIITCSYDLDILGNIKEENYSSIMNKEETKNKLKKVKRCGQCWLGCEVSPNWVSSLFIS